MSIDKNFLDKFMKATEFAAFGASPFIGKNDKIAADQGAVDEMRGVLNKIEMKATIVIGEGEMDKAPMLNIGEKVGTNNGPEFDIAVDEVTAGQGHYGVALAALILPETMSFQHSEQLGRVRKGLTRSASEMRNPNKKDSMSPVPRGPRRDDDINFNL